jgi:hypothetical protein
MFNTNCFAAPPDFGPGTESGVDPVLMGPGINNFDFAVFKRTNVTERMGIEFRTEFFQSLQPFISFNARNRFWSCWIWSRHLDCARRRCLS